MHANQKSKNVLAIGAHPDDIEILCAGTLALLKRKGYSIHLATLTSGDMGSATLPREEISRIRLEEARRSADVLGASYECMGASDFQVYFNDEWTRRVVALIRKTKPAMILTHSPTDYLSDHEETSKIVRQACFAAPVRNYSVPGNWEASEFIPHLYYTDSVEHKDIWGNPVKPSFVIDITEVIDVKAEMLACHASQRHWLRAQHGCDHYIEQMKKWSQASGALAGFSFGEGFRQHLGHAYPQEPLLQELLKSTK